MTSSGILEEFDRQSKGIPKEFIILTLGRFPDINFLPKPAQCSATEGGGGAGPGSKVL